MIRVLSLVYTERSLLKGFTGGVTDLAFAHLDSSLLGCLDEAGNLVVWQLTCTSGNILYPYCAWHTYLKQVCGRTRGACEFVEWELLSLHWFLNFVNFNC